MAFDEQAEKATIRSRPAAPVQRLVEAGVCRKQREQQKGAG